MPRVFGVPLGLPWRTGDILVGKRGAQTRLPVGANNTVLTADSTQPQGVKWSSAAGMTNPMTTVGDIIVGGTVTGGVAAPTRLAASTSGWVLTANGAGTAPSWQASASGFADPTTTKGDLIVHGSSTTRLGVGADTYVLTADSTQALGVKWAAAGSSGALVLLEQHTASSSATLDFTTAISSTYDEYVIEFVQLVPASSNVQLQWYAGTGAGPTWDSGTNYDCISQYFYNSATGQDGGSGAGKAYGLVAGSISSVTNNGLSGHLRLFGPGGSIYKATVHDVGYLHASVGIMRQAGNVFYKSATAMTGIRFLFSSGNIASGTIRMYGLSK